MPPALPTDTTAWSAVVQARWFGARLVDAASSVHLTPDVSLAGACILAAIAACVAATSRTLGSTRTVAAAGALGVLASQAIWGRLAAGHDALPVLLVAVGVLGALTARPWLVWTAASLTVVLAPGAIWLVVPALLAPRAGAVTRRVVSAIAVVVAALLVGAWLAHDAWGAATCLPSGGWRAALVGVWLPGRENAHVWSRVVDTLRLWFADVHAFGVAIGAYGLAASQRLHPAPAGTTLRAIGVGVLVTAIGAVSPAHATSLLLPWWGPWCAVGLTALLPAGRGRALAEVAAAAFAAVVPVLLHATVVPGPWVSGQPAISEAIAISSRDRVFAVDDAALARRLKAGGARVVAAERDAVDACVASRARVVALGTAVARLEEQGAVAANLVLHVPFRSLLSDVRPGHVVALGLSPSTAPWAGTAAARDLERRLGVSRAALASTPAAAVIARTDRDTLLATGRESARRAASLGEVLGGTELLGPVSVSVEGERTTIASGPAAIASGRDGALVVFDPALGVSLAAPVSAAADLPVSLLQQRNWRAAVVASFAPPGADGPGPLLLHGQTGTVDDDSPREIPVHATSGWYPPERLGGRLHQWSREATATITFRLATPADVTLVMDAAAASLDGQRPLVVRVNSHVLSEAWPGAARVTIPAGHLRAGDNIITLTAPAVVQPPGDVRALGVLVRQLRLLQ